MSTNIPPVGPVGPNSDPTPIPAEPDAQPDADPSAFPDTDQQWPDDN